MRSSFAVKGYHRTPVLTRSIDKITACRSRTRVQTRFFGVYCRRFFAFITGVLFFYGMMQKCTSYNINDHY